jgi:hypothetical protein
MNKRPLPPDDPELREALRAMAEADADLATPQRVEDALMRAWDSGAHSPTAGNRSGITWTVLAVAASLVLAVLALASRDRRTPSPDQTAQRSERETVLGYAAGAADGSDAMAWLDTDPASLEIVRLRVASATLAAQGYTVSDPDGSGSVEIEMIIGPDGAARSVRFNGAWPPETIY